MPARNRSSVRDQIAFLNRMIRATGSKVAHADPEDLAALIQLRATLDQAIQEAVDGLRADGFTWETIGTATGTTRQAALMKWGNTK